MSHSHIIRAWKDEEYRLSLSAAERAQLPENPAGLIELDDASLTGVAAGLLTLDLICESIRRCTFGDDCPFLIYTICGSIVIVCCFPAV